MHRWLKAPDDPNLGRCWWSDLLHTSDAFSMILPIGACKLTLRTHANFNISNENNRKLNACNFMIFVLGEHPKSHLERAWSWLSTLPLKAQRGSNYHAFRPPQNTKIIKNDWKTHKNRTPENHKNQEARWPSKSSKFNVHQTLLKSTKINENRYVEPS